MALHERCGHVLRVRLGDTEHLDILIDKEGLVNEGRRLSGKGEGVAQTSGPLRSA